MSKIKDLRSQDTKQLKELIVKKSKELFHNKMQLATDQLKQTHLIKGLRRDIARAKTVIAEQTKKSI